MSVPQDSVLHSFVQTWKTALQKILAQSDAAEVKIDEVAPDGLSMAGPDQPILLAVRFSGGGCLKGQLHFSVEKSTAVQCAQLFMAEPLDPAAEFTPTHQDAFVEWLRQVAGEFAVCWKELRGAEAELVQQSDPVGALSSQAALALQLVSDKCTGLVLRLDLDAELLASVSMTGAKVSPEVLPSEPQNKPNADSAVRQDVPGNLNLILDVELDATIRFGQREMLLKEVFALMPGSVVALNQMVNDPVELLVAGRLVATGEVIVVDGNFGLRVKDVVSPAQRAIALSLG